MIFNCLCGYHECFALTPAAIMPDKPVPYAFYPLLPDSDEEEEALAMIPGDMFRRRLRIRADATDETQEPGAGAATGVAAAATGAAAASGAAASGAA